MVSKLKQLTHKVAFTLQVIVTLFSLYLSACAPPASNSVLENMITPLAPTPIPAPTSERPQYGPGELVDYTAQDGDTLPALAARFNTTVEEIMQANPIIPMDATTMPVGLPMKIPIYYLALWGTTYKSLPDHAFGNGTSQSGFNNSAILARHTGLAKELPTYRGRQVAMGVGIRDFGCNEY